MTAAPNSRAGAIARAEAYFDDGTFLADLTRRVAFPSTSQEPERAPVLRAYLDDEIEPALARLGFTCRVLDNPGGPPALVAERMENPAFVTVLVYGHGDTVAGQDAQWRPGLKPWQVVARGRAHLRPRHRRQQRPAQRQFGRHRGGAAGARRARFQLQISD